MCLILLSYEPQNNNRLVVISNRDEFFDRSTEPTHYWSAQEIRSAVSRSTNKEDEKPQQLSEVTILAGRDSIGGGTWLGIDPKRNRFAAVTNFRMGMSTCLPRNSVVVNNNKSNNQGQSPSQSSRRKRSRGSLPIDFLTSNMDSMAYLRQPHITDGEAYDGFNMLVFDGKTLAYASNRKLDNSMADGEGGRPRELTGGIYGLCNGLLDDPWPKVVKGKELLEANLKKYQLISSSMEEISSLLNIMLDTERPPDDLLPDTGIPIVLERGYSSIFVHVP